MPKIKADTNSRNEDEEIRFLIFLAYLAKKRERILEEAAHKLDAQHREFAKKLREWEQAYLAFAKWLHEWKKVYLAFAVLDAISLNYSTIKTAWDFYLTDIDSTGKEMHDWQMTPAGLATTSISISFFIAYSMLATHFDDDDPNRVKRCIAITHPYFRDILKALKNAYKGIRSTIKLLESYDVQNVHQLIVPLSVLAGGLSAANRVWVRWMREERKKMMAINQGLTEKALAKQFVSLAEINAMRAGIQGQSIKLRIMAIGATLSGAFFDSLYYYMGVFSICAFAYPALVTMTVFCGIFFLTCLLTRLYEEYDYQRMLIIEQTKVELVLLAKEIEFSLNFELTDEQVSHLKKTVVELKNKRAALSSLLTLSYTSALLSGLKDGLAAYSFIGSAIFSVNIILTMFSLTCPPALIIAASAIGIACLLSFAVYSLYKSHQYLAKQRVKKDKIVEELDAIIGVLGKQNGYQALNKEDVEETIKEGIYVDGPPRFFFQAWFETLRSFFSGVGKGPKAGDYALGSMQEFNEDTGHYQDGPILCTLGLAFGAVHGFIFALRAFARGFGRPEPDLLVRRPANEETKAVPPPKTETKDYKDPTSLNIDQTQIEHEENAAKNIKTNPPQRQALNTQFSFGSSRGNLPFFAPPAPAPNSPVPKRSKSPLIIPSCGEPIISTGRSMGVVY